MFSLYLVVPRIVLCPVWINDLSFGKASHLNSSPDKNVASSGINLKISFALYCFDSSLIVPGENSKPFAPDFYRAFDTSYNPSYSSINTKVTPIFNAPT